jgi:hypothetical protein
LQHTYPCCDAIETYESWADIWTKPGYSVWVHSKDHKYLHNLEFCTDDPLVYEHKETRD